MEIKEAVSCQGGFGSALSAGAAQTMNSNPQKASALSGLRVLIVDDDPDACALVKRIFEEERMRAFIALSARDGLDILKHESPDVIVSDIGMPDQDGYELIRQIRKLPANQGGHTPAIALTAFARSEDKKQALAVGYQRHLAKPVDPRELIAVIAALTSGNRKE